MATAKLETIAGHILDHVSPSDRIAQEYGTSEDGSVESLFNYDTNKLDWADLHFQHQRIGYLGGIEFPEGENDDIACTVPRVLTAMRNIFDGKTSSRTDPMYRFLIAQAEQDKSIGEFRRSDSQFNVSREPDYQKHASDELECSFIYSIGVLKVGDAFIVAHQRTEDSPPVLLGKLKVPDREILPQIKSATINNMRMRVFDWRFAEGQNPREVRYY